MRLLPGVLVTLGLGAVLTIAWLAAAPDAGDPPRWPYADVSLRGFALHAPTGAPVRLEDLADRASTDLPDHVAVVETFDWEAEADEALVLGVEKGNPDMGRILDWRNAHAPDLGNPVPISIGRSAPDWFSRPRRTHDTKVAAAATALAAACVLLLSRLRRPRATTPSQNDPPSAVRS